MLKQTFNWGKIFQAMVFEPNEGGKIVLIDYMK